MKTTEFKPQGVIPACLLPFDSDLNLDEAAYRSHLRDLASVDGVTAVTVNGHAAEVHALTFEEQQRGLAWAMDEVGEQRPIVQGISTAGSLEAARLAAMGSDQGASALLVFPPESMALGGQERPEVARAHFDRITEACDLPIILFQYPLESGLGYPLETLVDLCQRFPTIRAIKDWCNDPPLHERHVRELHALDSPVAVLSTHSAWLLSSLVLGCDGLLSGAGSVLPDLQVALFRAVTRDDLAAARTIADRIYPLTRAFYRSPWLDMHNRMKEALVLLNRLPAAHVRPPLAKLPSQELEELAKRLSEAGLTPESVYQFKS